MKARISCFFLLVFFFVQMVKGEDDTLWQLHASDINAPYVGAPKDGPLGVSRVLKGINPFQMSMDVDGKEVNTECITNWKQCVDMKEATHNSSFRAAGKVDVDYSICALRNMPYAGLIRVDVKALSDVSLKVAARMDIPQEYSQPTQRFRKMRADAAILCCICSSATKSFRFFRFYF